MKPLETEASVSYPAILTTEGTYTLISFPDCPGCRTFVEPGEDVLAIAQDALSGWLEAAVEDREDSPHPTPQSQLSQTERVLACWFRWISPDNSKPNGERELDR